MTVRVQPYGLELGTDFAICGSKGNEFSCVRRWCLIIIYPFWFTWTFRKEVNLWMLMIYDDDSFHIWRCVRHRDIEWFYCNLEKTTQLRVAFRRVKLVTPRNHGWTVSPSVSGWYRVVPAYTDTPTKQWKSGPVVDIHPLETKDFLPVAMLVGRVSFGKNPAKLCIFWKKNSIPFI